MKILFTRMGIRRIFLLVWCSADEAVGRALEYVGRRYFKEYPAIVVNPEVEVGKQNLRPSDA